MAEIVSSEKKNGYSVVTFDDGTYGYVIDSGEYKTGYKTKAGASNAGSKKAKSLPQIIQSEQHDGYTVNTFSDGTYGYVTDSGAYKNGYKGKGWANKGGANVVAQEKADSEHAKVDALISDYAVRVQQVYSQAVSEMQGKVEGFLSKFEEKDAEKRAQLASGAITSKQYKDWKASAILQGKQYQAIAESLTSDLVNADKVAMNMATGYGATTYAANYNYGTYQVESKAKADTMFTLYDRDTVARLVAKDPDMLPAPTVDVPKDKAWNRKKVKSAITQGVLQGEGVGDVAKRLMAVADMDKRAAVRSARTMLTSIQNQGRVDSYKRAQGMGIAMKKEWMATLDGRTRSSHRQLDGERVKVDEKFSNGLMYPGDPSGPAFEVYNCRCTMIAAIDGVDYEQVERASKLGGMTYEEWRNEKLTRAEKVAKDIEARYKSKDEACKAAQQKLIDENETYSGIWKDDVTLADWEAKQGSVQAKLDYFDEQMKKAQAAGDGAAVEKWSGMISKTKDFDERGRKYAADVEEYKRLALERQTLRNKLLERGLIKDDPYSQERKDAAYWFKSAKDADKAFRSVSGSVWKSATNAERDAIYGYTAGSGAWNRPLSGFKKPWIKPGSGWEAEYSKGVGKVWIDYEGKGEEIRRMTDIIEKSTYDKDMWLQRGSGASAIESFLDIKYGSLMRMSDAQLQQYVGRSNRIGAFVSTGVSKGRGFSGDVIMNIYAPAGSEMMYAEPFSAFSGADYNGRKWDGEKGQGNIGQEAEMILQRGGSYTITKIEKSGGRIYMDLELHPEDGYDKFQQDPSEWTGSRETYR